MKMNFVEEDQKTCFFLKGELTSLDLDKIKKIYLDAVHHGRDIYINHDEVIRVDLSYLILLKSFSEMSRQLGLEFHVQDSPSAVLGKALAHLAPLVSKTAPV